MQLLSGCKRERGLRSAKRCAQARGLCAQERFPWRAAIACVSALMFAVALLVLPVGFACAADSQESASAGAAASDSAAAEEPSSAAAATASSAAFASKSSASSARSQDASSSASGASKSSDFDVTRESAEEESAAESQQASQESTQQQPVQEHHSGLSWPWIVFIVCAVLSAAVIGVCIGILKGYRNR